MIQTTLGELVDAQQALANLGKERLPVKTAYALSKVIRQVKKECDIFHEQHNAIVTQLGAVVGEQIRVKPENNADYEKRSKELRAIEVTLDVNPLPFSLFDTLKDFGGMDLAALTPLLSGLPE